MAQAIGIAVIIGSVRPGNYTSKAARLVEEGFPSQAANREILVPVFSLEGRIRKRKPMSEDSYVD